MAKINQFVEGEIKIKRFFTIFVLLAFLVIGPRVVWSNPYFIAEPPLATQTDWDLLNNGMLYVSYDTDHNGKVDFHTVRIVTTSYFSKRSVEDVTESYPENLVFFVDYDADHYFYISAKEPLFYEIDIDEDGQWDLVYKDFLEDGVNGNEIFYDNPSRRYDSKLFQPFEKKVPRHPQRIIALKVSSQKP